MENKKQKSILEKFNLFFDFEGHPLEFGSDNGREFINPSVNNYLLKNNVKMIHGLPYNPRSQGSVERIYLTIGNALLSIYLENINSFDLEFALSKVMNNYNNIVHSITKFTPNEIFLTIMKIYLKKFIIIYLIIIIEITEVIIFILTF